MDQRGRGCRGHPKWSHRQRQIKTRAATPDGSATDPGAQPQSQALCRDHHGRPASRRSPVLVIVAIRSGRPFRPVLQPPDVAHPHTPMPGAHRLHQPGVEQVQFDRESAGIELEVAILPEVPAFESRYQLLPGGVVRFDRGRGRATSRRARSRTAQAVTELRGWQCQVSCNVCIIFIFLAGGKVATIGALFKILLEKFGATAHSSFFL